MSKSYGQFKREQAVHKKQRQEVTDTLRITYGLSQSERIALLRQFQKTLSLIPTKSSFKTDVRARAYLIDVIASLSKIINATERGQSLTTE